MKNDPCSPVISYLRDSLDAMQAALEDAEFIACLEEIVELIVAAIAAGNKILLAGNGGSAADAQHIAGEFLARLNYDRDPIAAIALTTDSSVLTAIGNDYGYEYLFERQVRGLGRPGDVLIAISTSGRSPNILRAIEAARSIGLKIVGFTGKNDEQMGSGCHHCLRAPGKSTSIIQQLHITAGHIICGLVESRLFPRTA